ncbi:hypothetical protein Pint_16615 [Pistacia integerrima]|uniref:Uncharacterized protein n=1 Tax=Pistacia integerrima TaxID=434235 RepID=A0ACC0ZE96_9ROSI|nr:hypothetical protein Pint_16615 [Pistacia integerrima]
MGHTVGKDMIYYTVTNSNDDPLNPVPGTLRYGASIISRKVWITFQRHMNIKLKKPLLISSFTTINARGSYIHISGVACLLTYEDGLIDVIRGSTDVTISNNWFKNQDKVMLLGHNDKARYGFTHVANNLFQEWTSYAIGGRMNPKIENEANLFIAQKSGKKKVTWKLGRSSKLYSVGDVFENGAFFEATGSGSIQPNYKDEPRFQVANANSVRAFTETSGVLVCSWTFTC